MTSIAKPQMSSEAEIRQLLASILGPEVANAVSAEELIFERGIIDSLHLVELVSRMESRFGFQVEGHELAPENFGSIGAIAAYVDGKRARSAR